MPNRITLIATLNLTKIKTNLSSLNTKLCRVPFGRVTNREEADTLPFHITLIAWDISKKAEILIELSKIRFPKITVLINDIKIMSGKDNSYVLYFSIANNNNLKELINKIYQDLPSKNYSPDKLNFHITIHIDKNYSKIINMKEKLLENFKPFELEISEYLLYEIYPPKLINNFK